MPESRGAFRIKCWFRRRPGVTECLLNGDEGRRMIQRLLNSNIMGIAPLQGRPPLPAGALLSGV